MSDTESEEGVCDKSVLLSFTYPPARNRNLLLPSLSLLHLHFKLDLDLNYNSKGGHSRKVKEANFCLQETTEAQVQRV